MPCCHVPGNVFFFGQCIIYDLVQLMCATWFTAAAAAAAVRCVRSVPVGALPVGFPGCKEAFFFPAEAAVAVPAGSGQPPRRTLQPDDHLLHHPQVRAHSLYSVLRVPTPP